MDHHPVNAQQNVHPTQSKIVKVAKKQIGKPYVWGASGPDAFDCSGFVSYVYSKVRRGFGRLTTWGLARVGTRVYGRLHPGDIIIVDGGEHVVLYIGNGTIIHAPNSGSNVRYAPVSPYLRRAYSIRRVIPWKTKGSHHTKKDKSKSGDRSTVHVSRGL